MRELVMRAKAHDADAFLELIETYSNQMYKTAWSVLKNEADAADAVQDTIVTCFEKIGDLRTPDYFGTWLIRILLNHCFSIRDQQRRMQPQEDVVLSGEVEDGLANTRFAELLSLADERYHVILTLYYADECTIAEIASLLSMNENTVKTKLKRARDQIRRGLNEEDTVSYGY